MIDKRCQTEAGGHSTAVDTGLHGQSEATEAWHGSTSALSAGQRAALMTVY